MKRTQNKYSNGTPPATCRGCGGQVKGWRFCAQCTKELAKLQHQEAVCE